MTDEHPLSYAIARLELVLSGLMEGCQGSFDAAADEIARTITAGGKVLVAGNGGSAAESVHLVGELIGRLGADRERKALPGVALVADAATLTALGNDYGFEQIFARQVEAIGRAQDALVVLSTSGASPNLVAAVEVARERGITTIGLLGGSGQRLHALCDVAVVVPSALVAPIQECHLVLVHALVAAVEDRL